MSSDSNPKRAWLYGPDGNPIERPAPIGDRPGQPERKPKAAPANTAVNLDYLEPPTESTTFELPPIDSNLLLIAGGFGPNRVGIPVTVSDNSLTELRLNVRYAGTAPINLEILEYDTDLLWGRVAWTIKGRTQHTLKLRLKGMLPPETEPAPVEAS